MVKIPTRANSSGKWFFINLKKSFYLEIISEIYKNAKHKKSIASIARLCGVHLLSQLLRRLRLRESLEPRGRWPPG